MKLNLSNNSSEVKYEAQNCLLFEWQVSEITPNTFALVVAILLCLMSVCTVIGNGLVIFTVYRTSSLHSPPNLIISGLALSDLGTGLITQPSNLLEFVAAFYGDHCTANTAFLVLNISGWLFTLLSLYTLMCIAIERCFAVVFHLRYKEKVTMKRTLVVLLSAWVIIPLASALISVKKLPAQKLLWAQAIFTIFGILITCLCYFKVFLVTRRHFRQIRNQLQGQPMEQLAINTARHRRKFCTLLYIVGTSVACYLPYSVLVLAGFRQRQRVILLTLGIGGNSCLNPLIYFWRISDLRQAARKYVIKLFRSCSSQ